jgi:uncharacterized HAD superfamily protein
VQDATELRGVKIAVDLDGVLAEAMIIWCELYNRRYGRSLSFEDIRGWDAWKLANISRDEFFTILDDAWSEWERMPPTEEDVSQQVKLLNELGTVDVVTGRSVRTVEQAKEWLKMHEIQYNRFVRTESTVAKIRLDYDVFVDDSPHLMESIASRSTALGILYTRPWNRETRMPSVIRRANSWSEIPPIVRTARQSTRQIDG